MNHTDVNEEREFIDAAAAVYAWISCADGEVTKSEISSFVEYLNQSNYVDEITEEDFSELFLTLIEAFTNDFDDGKARAQTRIESFSGNHTKSKELIKLARKALVADSKLNEAEELVLSEISDLLKINEDEV